MRGITLNIPVKAKKWPLSKKERLGMMGLSTTHQGGALIMKFKQSEAQNQRIERITTSHLIVLIDMAKETYVAQVTNYRGIVLTNRHLSFSSVYEH